MCIINNIIKFISFIQNDNGKFFQVNDNFNEKVEYEDIL